MHVQHHRPVATTGQQSLFQDEDGDIDEDKVMENPPQQRDMLQPYPLMLQSKGSKNDALPTNICIARPISPSFHEIFPDEKNPFRQPEVFPLDQNPFRQQQDKSGSDTPNPAKQINPLPPMSTLTSSAHTNLHDESPTPKRKPYSENSPVIESKGDANTTERTPSPQQVSATVSVPNASPKTQDEALAQATMLALSLHNQPLGNLRLYLDNYTDSAFTGVLRVLRKHPQICKLDIYRSWKGENKRTRTSRDMIRFFEMVRTLPKLEVLHLSNFELVDLEHLHDTLYAHPTLKELRLHLSCGAVSIQTLRILATIPGLAEVTLDMNESFPFQMLLRSPSLRKLHIVANNFSFNDAHLMTLVQGLQINDSLTELHLEPSMTLVAFRLVVYALRVNRGLESFRVSLAGSPQDADHAVQELATVLRQNKTLKSLWNLQYSSLQVSPDSKRRILAALLDNPTSKLDQFLFFDEDASFRKRKEQLLRLLKNPGADEKTPQPSLLEGFPICGSGGMVVLPNMSITGANKWIEQAKDKSLQFSSGLSKSCRSLFDHANSLGFLVPCRSNTTV